jgi:uncharacterized membrane protein
MWLRLAIAAASAVGAGIAAYLNYTHYVAVAPICTTGGCETVQRSSYSELAGVPVALLGLVAYLFLIASAALGGVRAAFSGALVAIVGVAFSAYLLWAQIVPINAICQWCVGNDVVIAVVTVLCVIRVVIEPTRPVSSRLSGLWPPHVHLAERPTASEDAGMR